jgi:formylmethanofuran dehydrogenase subunit E
MQYQTHDNPLNVYCARCDRDITLESQEIVESKVLCERCYMDDETPEE